MVEQYATFYLKDNMFAVNVLLVQEINRNPEVTDVDPSPDFVVGLMNLRGQIVTVLDLGVRFGLDRIVLSKKSRCVVLKTDNEIEKKRSEGLISEKTSVDMVGLLVDGIGEMVTLESEDMEPPPANIHGVDSKYIKGIIKLDKNVVPAINTTEILEIEEMQV